MRGNIKKATKEMWAGSIIFPTPYAKPVLAGADTCRYYYYLFAIIHFNFEILYSSGRLSARSN
jgi:hypothetical protein